MNEALLQSAARFHESGNLMEAARLYSDIIRANPRHFDALHRLGLIHFQMGRFGDAERLFAAAIQINPQAPEVLYGRGCALQGLQRHEDALKPFAQALALRPDYLEVRNNRGVSLLALKRYQDALQCFEKALAARPGLAMVESNRAAALVGLERHAEALHASENAIAGDSSNADAWYNKGTALAGLARFNDALAAFDRALLLKPDSLEALSYRGIALAMLDRHEDALLAYAKGLRLAPSNIDLLYNRCTSLLGLKRFEEALADCEKVLAGDPSYKYAKGCLVHCKLQLCEWRGLEKEKADLAAELRAGKRVLRPLQNVLISTRESDLLQCSRIWTENDCPKSPTPVWRGERYEHSRIRVAYVSADFRSHAVAGLMAGVFEHHDKKCFETIAISLKQDKGEMRNRLEAAFEHFIDVRKLEDKEAASLMRQMDVDIAVDLMGFTEGSRTGIFALRPAPVQVNYLGFAGTMGADYIDYILADRIVAPQESSAHYSEKLVQLPHSYMPGDDKRRIASVQPGRAEAGLPDSGFVFCSFNNVAKICPPMFDVWMRLLRQIDGSVLWLSAAGATAMRNLRREAEVRGVEPHRLVFASFTQDSADHLARHSLADLFLDTLPYNAHAGGSDALWTGVPIVSCVGSTFAGRVGASLLNAVGLPELATDSLDAYEELALKLARDASALAAIKGRLQRNRDTHPLFDTKRFTRNLEAAYRTMWQRQQRGEPPASFSLDDSGDMPAS